MTPGELMDTLERQGIVLLAHGDCLRYHPQKRMTPELLANLKACKEGVLALLGLRELELVPELGRPGIWWSANLMAKERDQIQALFPAGVSEVGSEGMSQEPTLK